MITSEVTYREASRHLLALAHAELDAGDLRQASEKAWGAAAQIVKAAAERLGWDHDSHRGLYLTVRRIRDETADQDIQDLFAFANYLHTNFYENTLADGEIARYLARTENFITKIEAILDASPSNGR